MIDSALINGISGIYQPYIAVQTIKPFFEQKNYNVEWLHTVNTCQIDANDVFCQSWSLYLQVMYFNAPQIEIPEDQYGKYELLLKFYKRITLAIPEFCENLNTLYYNQITKNKLVVNYQTGHEAKRMKESILALGTGCQLLTSMQPQDMF